MRTAAATLVLALVLAGSAVAQERTLSMSGSTSAMPVVADLAFFYGRADPAAPRFSLVGGGTATGIADAARGIVDAGMVSRELGRSDPPGLVLTRIALSGICLVTNRANAVPALSHAQVQDLLAGRVGSWSQVPGSSRHDTIVPVALDAATGARSVFEATFVDAATQVAYAPRVFRTAAQVREFVAATPASWGYVDVAFTRGLHAVPYEGVPCTRQTVASERYPARRPLGVVTRGRPRGAVARFLRWVANSRKAREVIETRYVSVGRG